MWEPPSKAKVSPSFTLLATHGKDPRLLRLFPISAYSRTIFIAAHSRRVSPCWVNQGASGNGWRTANAANPDPGPATCDVDRQPLLIEPDKPTDQFPIYSCGRNLYTLTKPSKLAGPKTLDLHTRDRKEPCGPSLPHHRAYGSVHGGSARLNIVASL